MFYRVSCHPLHAFPRLPPATCFPTLTTRYMFFRAWNPLHVFPLLQSVTCFPALTTRYMFSRAWNRLHVFPHLQRLHVLPRLQRLDVFPRLPPATIFNYATCFPLLQPVKSFPALTTRYMFSRPWNKLHVFPRLPPVTCFPALTTRYMFSRAYHSHGCTISHHTDWLYFNITQPLKNRCAVYPPLCFDQSLTLSSLILSIASLTSMKQLSGRNTSSMYCETCQTSSTGQTCHDEV